MPAGWGMRCRDYASPLCEKDDKEDHKQDESDHAEDPEKLFFLPFFADLNALFPF